MILSTTIAVAPDGARYPVLDGEDYQQVMSVVASYGRFYDDGRMDDFFALFTEDAIFHPNWPGVAPDEVCGLEALRPFFGGARRDCDDKGVQPRHYATNPIVTEAGADRAGVTVGMLYVETVAGGAGEVRMAGQYDYMLAKRAGRWFIARWSMRYDK